MEILSWNLEVSAADMLYFCFQRQRKSKTNEITEPELNVCTHLLQWVPRWRLMMITLSMASRNLRVACMGLDREWSKLMWLERSRSRTYVVQTSIFGLVSPLISTFPPCRRVLAQHIKRVNFQVCIWRRALDHFPEIPSPLDQGYIVTEAGKLEPLFFKGDIIPTVLVYILEENGNDEEITDEIHTVYDYDKDENDEYDDN